MILNCLVKIVEKNKTFIVFLNNKLFLKQKFFISSNGNLGKKNYTFFYILKLLKRFGLI